MNTLMALGFSSLNSVQANRPVRLRFPRIDTSLDDVLFVKRVDGSETLCGGIEYRLLCLSNRADLPLKDFMAVPVAIEFVTDRGELHSVCGIVAQAFAGQSDGGLATYQLVVRDALALMEQRANTRVFRNRNEVQISEILIREWRSINPILAQAFELDTSGLTKTYSAREFTMQNNESDAAFLRRLWKRQGIASFIQPCRTNDASVDTPTHTLVLFDTPFSLRQNAAGTVRFHRDGSTEARDGIFNWSAARTLKVGSLNRQSWDYRQRRMTMMQSPTVLKQGATGDQFAAALDDHRIDVPHAGHDSGDYRRLTDLRMQRHEYEAKCSHGESGVRDFSVGQWFKLDGHPEIDRRRDEERQFVLTELLVAAENNVPKETDERAQRLFAANGWHHSVTSIALTQASEARDVRYTNRFTCVRRGIPIVPSYDPDVDVPRATLQSAIVVGPQAEEVHCDELGRIKLRFPGTREQDHADGAGASDTDRDSAWVRVLSFWAGNRWGSIGLPRVGDEVMVDFVGGDPDKPVVVGSLYGGGAFPPAFSHTGGLPGNRFLTGIKSKEIQGIRYNQLRLDDTPGQISAQLASEHGHSQLNLGWLAHPRTEGQGQARGEGAELRSDQSVVVRAARLLLLTTQAMLGATGKQLEREPLEALLEGSLALLKELGEFGEQHKAMAIDPAPVQSLAAALEHAGQGSGIQSKDAGSADTALLAQYGHGGFINVTPKSSVHSSGLQHNIMAQQHIQVVAGQRLNLHAGKGLSMFSHQNGMRHIARAGRLDIQAQQDSIGIAAERDVTMTASQGDVVVAAKTSLTLSCGGAYIKIANGKIELGCPGDFVVKAGMHKWEGATQQETVLPFFPAADHVAWLKLDLDGYQGKPMANVPYTLFFENGQQKDGTLDGNGMAEERNLPDVVTKVMYHNAPSAKDALRPVVDDLLAGLHPLMDREPSTSTAPQNWEEF